MFTAKFKIILFFCLSAIIFNFNHPLSGDEGAVLNGAWQIAHGKIPYQDFFLYWSPGSFYLVKWALDLFGYSYFAAKTFSVLLLLMSPLAIYKITKYLTKIDSLSIVTAWIWLLAASNTLFYPLISYNTFSTFTNIAALLFLIRAVKFNRWSDFFLTGLFLSGSIIILQHKGLLAAFALGSILLIYLIKKEIRLINFVTAILATTIFPLIAISYWGIKPIFENLILWPLRNDIPFNPIQYQNFIILLIVFTAAILYLAQKKSIDKLTLAAIVIIQIASLASIYTRLDGGHFLINSFGIIIIATSTVYYLFTKSSLLNHKKTVKVTMAILVLSIFSVYIPMNIAVNKIINEFYETAEKLQITEVYAHPFLPQMYFELKLENPYRYDTLFTGIHPQEYFIENLTTLLIEDPKYIIVSYDVVEKFNYTLDNPLDQYIHSHYKTKTNLSNIYFLEKSDTLD